MLKDLRQFQKAVFAGEEAIRLAQTTRLREHLLYCKEKSKAYGKLFKQFSLDLKKFMIEDLLKFPLTEKKDIEKNPELFYAVESTAVRDIVLSSGSTGKPLKVIYTEHDLLRLAYNEEQSFAACGIQAGDVVLLTCTLDRCFVAGLAYFLGMRSLGAASIRNGHGTMESHASVLASMKPTVMVGVPSFLKKLGTYLQKIGAAPQKLGIKKLICIGEPIRNQDMTPNVLGSDLKRLWQADIFSTYASTETVTTFCECVGQQGGHLIPDIAIVEIVDEHGNKVPDGSVGEIVVTPMAVEGMPLIRYKTGDMSFLMMEPCACGRFSPRLGPILGRKNQLMKVKGTSLYPQAVFTALEAINDVSDYCVEVSRENDLSDQLTVYAAMKNGNETAASLEEKLASRLRVKPRVIFEDEKTIREKIFPEQSRKPVRFVDRRR